MIEGTRTYKGKQAAVSPVQRAMESSSTTGAEAAPAGDAVNLERRELFQQIIPMAGKGLVKILRESNLLKAEVGRLWKRQD